MKREIFIIFFIISFFCVYYKGWTQQEEKVVNPFKPRIPTVVKTSSQIDETQSVESPEFLEKLNLQGIIWGTDTPCAIIDGNVYRVGDKLKLIDAKIVSIDKAEVELMYLGVVYKLKIKNSFKKGGER